MIERNEQEVYNRIMELTDLHISLVDGGDELESNEDKIAAVLYHFE